MWLSSWVHYESLTKKRRAYYCMLGWIWYDSNIIDFFCACLLQCFRSSWLFLVVEVVWWCFFRPFTQIYGLRKPVLLSRSCQKVLQSLCLPRSLNAVNKVEHVQEYDSSPPCCVVLCLSLAAQPWVIITMQIHMRTACVIVAHRAVHGAAHEATANTEWDLFIWLDGLNSQRE